MQVPRVLLANCAALAVAVFAGYIQIAYSATETLPGYVLGPGDQITIFTVEPEEINNKPVRIGTDGNISLPLVGRFKAGGLTVPQFEDELCTRLKPYVNKPEVSVSVTEYRSQPVSVLGEVNNPGVQQLQGRKTLLEVISQAGGLKTDAGNAIRITRFEKWGAVPVPGATDNADRTVSYATISVRELMSGSNPQLNIPMMPQDVVMVSKAKIVYVLGAVRKPGGYALNDNEQLSALQVIALAGGLDIKAKPQATRVIRTIDGKRTETETNLNKTLSGKAPDFMLQGDDMVFVPESVAKRAIMRTLETAVQTASGLIIYRGY